MPNEASLTVPKSTKRRLSRLFTNTGHKLHHLIDGRSTNTHPSVHTETNLDGRVDELNSHRRKVLGAVPDQWSMYSHQMSDYEITHPIGFGSSSIVRLAKFKPIAGELCAVKIIDLDRLTQTEVECLRRETQLMSLAKHPNILRVRGEWVEGSKLYISTRLMRAGSLADIMSYRFPDGLEEVVIATVLIQALAGLHYLHSNGPWIHRDIKAANLLVDDDGTVLLADFGVSVAQDYSTPIATTPKIDNSPQSSPEMVIQRRRSFVGTAPFIAPEVIQGHGYDERVDIWSLGITALELAMGKAPHSLIPPSRVLLKTVEDPSPTLNRYPEGSPYQYSKTFKAFIDRCLVKAPDQRPSSRDLLFDEKFFDRAKGKHTLIKALLADLPPLETRQERRRIGSITPGDVPASNYWNFAATLTHHPDVSSQYLAPPDAPPPRLPSPPNDDTQSKSILDTNFFDQLIITPPLDPSVDSDGKIAPITTVVTEG